MELRIGMEIELIKDLDCGIRTVKQGSIFIVESITDKIAVTNKSIGTGVFNKNEIKEYFKIYEREYDIDVKRVIYSDRATVVILNSGIKGISKCLKDDIYDKEIGYRVAYLKAKIKEMNKELKKY